jgi:hypothetical protein
VACTSSVNVFAKQIVAFHNISRLMMSFLSRSNNGDNSSRMLGWLFGMDPPLPE